MQKKKNQTKGKRIMPTTCDGARLKIETSQPAPSDYVERSLWWYTFAAGAGNSSFTCCVSLSFCVCYSGLNILLVSSWSSVCLHLSALSFLLSPQHEWPQCCATVSGAFLQCHQICSYSPHGGPEARTQRSKDSYTSYSEYRGLSSSLLLLWVVESWQALWGRGFSLWKTGKEV